MKNIKYLLLCLAAFVACNEPEDVLKDTNIEPEPVVVLPDLTAGSADFSKYVALGNSLTAGITDGALFIAGQQNSYPNILSQKFALVGGGAFTQPLMSDNTGGLLLGTTQITPFRLVTTGGAPMSLTDVIGPVTPTSNLLTNNPTGPFNNMGVPSAKSFHLLAPGYGNLNGLLVTPRTANPFFVRMASSPTATIMGDAMAQNPSFFSLWIGANDVLGYALSGGDGSNPITDQATFNTVYNGLIGTLTSGGAKGVIANIPDVTTIAFLNTIPNNALEINASTAAQLTGFFQAVAGIANQVFQQPPFSLPSAQAQALAAQYAITFEEGANRFLIDVPVTPANPLGFRQMTEDELLVLTIDQDALAQGYGSVALSNEVLQVLGILQAGGTITPQQGALVLAAVNGIDDKDALDSDEIQEIKDAVDGYNTTIANAASSAGLALVDAYSIIGQITSIGYGSNNFILTGDLVTGGAFSLDGIHPTSRGYALVANEFMKAIDATYGSNFEASGNLVDIGNYPTNYSPTLQ